MGRPRKNPEYNPEEQFQKMLEDVKGAYENADSLRSLATELNMTLLKLRKLLITAGIFTSDICMEVNQLHEQGKLQGFQELPFILICLMSGEFIIQKN